MASVLGATPVLACHGLIALWLLQACECTTCNYAVGANELDNATVQEVKESANSVIASTPCLFPQSFGRDHANNGELFSETTDLLTRKALGRQLHWREAVVAQLLFMHVAPCTDATRTMEGIVAAQVHDMLNGSTVVAKVCSL
jgi:hypothetical protein